MESKPMTDPMNRTQELENWLKDFPWEEEIIASDLDSVSAEKTDSTKISVFEPSGEYHKISYTATNTLTAYLFKPEETLKFIEDQYKEASNQFIGDLDKFQSETEIYVNKELCSFVTRQDLMPICRVLNEIEDRYVRDIERYYTTTYIRVVRKNYDIFGCNYSTFTKEGFFTETPKPIKVIYHGQRGSSATNW